MSQADAALAGKRIWVTRPVSQAAQLCALIRARGGIPVRLPTLVIEPNREALPAAQAARLLVEADVVIFISRNAVLEAHKLLAQLPEVLQSGAVLAVGQATAAALSALGTPCVRAAPGSDATEALLRLPELSTARVRGRRVLLARGTGGRETLRERLQQRGAAADYLEVYRRVKPDISEAEMMKFWHDQTPDAIVITSLAGLDNLVALTPPKTRTRLRRTSLVVMSERIRQHACDTGFGKVAVATGNSDTGLLQALVGLCGST